MKADDEISSRYVVLKYLGKGTFGTVVECWDRTAGKRVAVKVIKSIQKYRDAAMLEIRILEHLGRFDVDRSKHVVHLLDKFDHANHICMVFELLSVSLYDYMKSNTYRPFPRLHLQSFARQLFESVEFIHSLSIIHTDIKPENILLVSDKYEIESVNNNEGLRRSTRKNAAKNSSRVLLNTDIKLIDFGSAVFSTEYHASIVSTRHYRAPEIVLCIGWSFPCDIWSIGCIIVEWLTGEALFQTHDNLEHLVLMTKVLGQIPVNICNETVSKSQGGQDFFRRATRGYELFYPDQYTTAESQKYVASVKPLEDIVLCYPHSIKRKVECSSVGNDPFLHDLLDLLRRCLDFDPRQRITARSALQHPFFSRNNKKLSVLFLYETRSRFYFIGNSGNEREKYQILKIDRTQKNLSIIEDETEYTSSQVNEMLTMIDTGNKATGGLKKVCSVRGIVGFAKFLHGYYIYVITGATVIAEITGHSIYAIDSTRLIPLDPTPERSQEEQRVLTLFSRIDLSKNFYFSYTFDITNSLQHNLTQKSELFYNEMFVWNYSLLKTGFQTISYSSPWILPLIHGYICQSQLEANGRKILMTLIARRSRHFAGARFHKRGVNDEGFVANEVETEQLVFDSSLNSGPTSGYTSFVQHRGSIPLYWSQDVSNLSPKPPIHINAYDPFYSASAIHFQRLFNRYGPPLCILNLVKHKENTRRESILLDEYGEAVRYLNQFLPDTGKIKYIAFDMSHASKSYSSADQDVIGLLEKISEKFILTTRFFEFSRRRNNFQQGIVRTNCIDCLDRTNAAQFIIGKCALAHQLHSLSVIDKPELSMDCNAVKVLMEMYHDHGDIIALQYGGSALVNTMETYQKVNAWSSHSRDMFESLKRYYSNSFTDAEKQDAISLFLGNFECKKSAEGQTFIELKGDFYFTQHNREKEGNYREWFNRETLEKQKKHVDFSNFEQPFESYYSTWKYTSFNNQYMYDLLNSRKDVDPFESPFRPVSDLIETTSTATAHPLIDIEDYSSESETEIHLELNQQKKKYPPNSSARLAEKNLNPKVKAEEAKEYERYVALFKGNLRFSNKEIGEDPDQYNVAFYQQNLSMDIKVDPKDYALYQSVFDFGKQWNDGEGYKRWLETGKFY